MVKQDAQLTHVLAVDVTNEITRFGLFYNHSLVSAWSISTPEHITVDEAWLAVITFLNITGVGFSFEKMSDTAELPVDSILSCVVPDLASSWIEALRMLGQKRPLVVGPGIKTGIQMSYNDPSELGSDRIADIVAAKKRYGHALTVIDCGTAITYQVLDKKGIYVGGLIVLGMQLSAKTLAQTAARLPSIELNMTEGVLGKNTRESVQSGILRGEVARINGLIEMIWQELGYETTLVLTGEDAALLAPMLKHEAQVSHHLTLEGLNELYHLNRK